ncbi:hypothetical protein A1359_14540 [Methylomonas lenta]|uniref:Phospholipase D-like domain-containing protein n=1 Tax=Methylomonas lenta TaxID=980561 RepID=A0A177N0E3_9GAMM|nr:phospholipase D family protein [Methylomonas lenta]OAI11362.1 hypothetical protein A1359_14540 [Methylomonas lenta]
MAEFLDTESVNMWLARIIKNARERVLLVSPYLKFSDRIKEFITDKNNLKIDVQIVYGKEEPKPDVINWLNNLPYVRASYCKNLHAKCYLNEELCIVTSMNLYEFSQQNNNEMGVLFSRQNDLILYNKAFEEVQRLIRISEGRNANSFKISTPIKSTELQTKIPTHELAKRRHIEQKILNENLLTSGLIKLVTGKGIKGHYALTARGIEAGGEPEQGTHIILWPENLKL